jgi:hypothetical protein
MIWFYVSVLQENICSIKSMEQHTVHGLVGLIYACSYLSVFIIISYFEQMVKCVEFPRYLLRNESGAQMYYPSLFRTLVVQLYTVLVLNFILQA